MPNMNLELDETRLFGKFFPTVFLNRIIINYPDNAYGVPDVFADLRFSATMTLNITQPADSNINIESWVAHNMDNLSMYVCLSPFSELNTQLEASSLDLKELFGAMFTSGLYGASADAYNSSLDGFYSVISYIKQSFINNWHIGDGFAADAYTEGTDGDVIFTDDFRSENLYNTSTVGPEFWGTDDDGQLNLEGPWATSDPDCYVALLLPWVLETYGSTTDDGAGAKFIQKPLVDAISSGEISEVMYDTAGNKIVEISNIPIEFSYATSTTSGDDPATEAAAFEAVNSILESTEKLFIVSTVGTSYMLDNYGDVDNKLFNANFGNISYEFLLNNGAPPPQEETVYVKIQTQEIVNSLPIQTRNQKYYEAAPINQQEIRKSIENLISNFTVLAEKDQKLAKNIQNLESLLATHGSSIDLLPKLFKYGASYVGKDRASRSGKFFMAISKFFTSYNNAVGEQAQLSKNLVLNDRVVDRRPPSASMSYWPPSPLGNFSDPSSWVFSDTGDDYIPLLWTKMSRYVEQTVPTYGLLSDFVEYAMGEGFAASGGYGGAGILDEGDEIFSEDMMAGNSFGSHESNPASVFSDAVVANKGSWFFDYEKALHKRSLLAQVVNIRRMQDLFHMTVPYDYFKLNFSKMSRNEYELQLQNDPDASASTWRTEGVINTSQTLTFDTTLDYPKGGLTTYSYDPMKMKYGQPFVFLSAGSASDPSYDHSIELDFDDTPFHVPTYADALDAISKDSLWGDTTGTGTDADIWVLSDYIKSADATHVSDRSNSYLRFQVFDVATSVEEDRLEGFGLYKNLDWNAEGGHGQGPLNGYRLISFNYRDYMDDDVAYYNTYGSYHGDRNGIVTGFISRLVDGAISGEDLTSVYADLTAEYAADPSTIDTTIEDDVWTSYGVSVSVDDLSLKFFTTEVLSQMKSAYTALEEYQTMATQICSANSITGRFNEFFSEAMEAHFSAEQLWPWVHATYMYNAIRDLLFNSFSGGHGTSTKMDALMEQARRDADVIGPHNGSLEAIESYRNQFKRILTLIDPSMDGTVAYCPVFNRMRDLLGLEDAGMPDAEIWEYIKATPSPLLFANTIPIVGQIYGNMSLSAFWENSIVDAPSATCTDESFTATADMSTMDPAAWMACVWPTYLAMRAGTNIGSGLPTYYKSASRINMAGEYSFSDPETYWQESVLVQAFINQFRTSLDSTLPDLPLDPVSAASDYTSWQTEAWFWPSPDTPLPWQMGGPNYDSFTKILRELGITGIPELLALCLGWQTLHIGTEGMNYEYNEIIYTVDQFAPSAVQSPRPDPLPYKFGFRPRFFIQTSRNDWPRTYPIGQETFNSLYGFGNHVNKLIYVPDQSWWTSSTSFGSGAGARNMVPILWGLNANEDTYASSKVTDAQEGEGVIFEPGVGFVDKSADYVNGSFASVIAYQSRLPYNTDETMSVIDDFAEAMEALTEIFSDSDPELE
jgi:hypothetical protein